jgi:hypothetical protein
LVSSCIVLTQLAYNAEKAGLYSSTQQHVSKYSLSRSEVSKIVSNGPLQAMWIFLYQISSTPKPPKWADSLPLNL